MPNKTLVIDWDGTLVENVWPRQDGEWMPGAIGAMHKLHAAGFKLEVFSCRLSPYEIDYTRRPPGAQESEIVAVRDKLDQAGLTFVDIFLKEGKPTAWMYIDDKAERYHGTTGSWNKLYHKIMLRAAEDA